MTAMDPDSVLMNEIKGEDRLKRIEDKLDRVLAVVEHVSKFLEEIEPYTRPETVNGFIDSLNNTTVAKMIRLQIPRVSNEES